MRFAKLEDRVSVHRPAGFPFIWALQTFVHKLATCSWQLQTKRSKKKRGRQATENECFEWFNTPFLHYSFFPLIFFLEESFDKCQQEKAIKVLKKSKVVPFFLKKKEKRKKKGEREREREKGEWQKTLLEGTKTAALRSYWSLVLHQSRRTFSQALQPTLYW